MVTKHWKWWDGWRWDRHIWYRSLRYRHFISWRNNSINRRNRDERHHYQHGRTCSRSNLWQRTNATDIATHFWDQYAVLTFAVYLGRFYVIRLPHGAIDVAAYSIGREVHVRDFWQEAARDAVALDVHDLVVLLLGDALLQLDHRVLWDVRVVIQRLDGTTLVRIRSRMVPPAPIHYVSSSRSRSSESSEDGEASQEAFDHNSGRSSVILSISVESAGPIHKQVLVFTPLNSVCPLSITKDTGSPAFTAAS